MEIKKDAATFIIRLVRDRVPFNVDYDGDKTIITERGGDDNDHRDQRRPHTRATG